MRRQIELVFKRKLFSDALWARRAARTRDGRWQNECPPALRFSGSEGRFNREILVFRSNFNNGCSLNVQPPFTTGSNCPLRRGNQPFAHTELSLPPTDF
jgi:hypothetical protein